MPDKVTLEELRSRIGREIQHYNGILPERVTIAWDGYLAALIEWGLLSVKDHGTLVDLLPKVEDNPVVDILLGRPDID